jgi:sulfonate transport system ATP-binding protein
MDGFMRTASPEAAAADIRAAGISKTFQGQEGDVVALLDVSLQVRPGEFLSIIGGSGCGKSTLLRIVAGLERPDAGEVTVADQRVSGPGKDRGIMFQDHRLLPWLTVERNVAFGLGQLPRREALDLARETLGVVGLAGFEQAYPHQLSGGMAQRAALARVLVNKPRVLLLDEPFGALDALTKIQMQEELLRLWQAERATVILVTHDIDEAVFLGDRVAIMASRPGTIRRFVPVDLPRPRDRSSADFVRIRKSLFGEFFKVSDANREYEI